MDYTVQTRNHYLGNDHAYILLDGGNYYIVDNNTQNHTYLNERRLEPSKPTLFHAGDTIRMADVVFNDNGFPDMALQLVHITDKGEVRSSNQEDSFCAISSSGGDGRASGGMR